MSNGFKLVGGTAGYNKLNETKDSSNNAKKLYMFHQDAKISAVFINKKTRLEGCILPAFDSSMDKMDTAYKSGYSPYRVPNMTDPETGCPYFSDWFMTLPGYNYYGNGKMNFFSPKAVGCADPIQDIRDYCWKLHNAGDTTYDYLLNRPEKFGAPYGLPKVTQLTLLNVVCPATYDKDPVQGDANRILVLKPAATDRMFADLNTPTPNGMENTSGDQWADIFCYGDVTNPASAIKFSVTQGKLDNGMDYACLSFGQVRLNGMQRALSCKRTEIDPQYLEGRYDLTDLDNIIYVPSYQEIVDMLVQDNLIPFELISTVCGEKAHVRRDAGVVPDIASQAYSATGTNTVPAPAPAPTPAPAPAPANVEESLYVTINGATEKMTISQINILQDPDLPVYNGSSWASAATFPWYKVAPVLTPVQVPAPAPAPAKAAPIMPPAGDEKPRRTKEQEDRLNALNRALMKDEMLDAADINELSQLSRMAPYIG